MAVSVGLALRAFLSRKSPKLFSNQVFLEYALFIIIIFFLGNRSFDSFCAPLAYFLDSKSKGIEILVDLGLSTSGSRTETLALRPAPIQGLVLLIWLFCSV